MSMLTNCLKGLAAIAIIAASPIFIVFAAPFGCGLADDVLNAIGTPAAIAVTAAACLAAWSWTRHRPRDSRRAATRPRLVKALGLVRTTHAGS
jgi:hypothetical protein